MSTFINQYPLIIPFASILLAECAKALIDVIGDRQKVRFISTGGMPSGHSAFVAALVVVAANKEGIGSMWFTVSAVLALIVMYDAVTLRRQVGLHAKMLNQIDKTALLDESVGHRLGEVVAGACFGALVAFGLLMV